MLPHWRLSQSVLPQPVFPSSAHKVFGSLPLRTFEVQLCPPPPRSDMDLPVELAKKLDFSHGRKFRKEVLQLFGSSVHHVESSPAGSFFLLVTFRRYTFRLTEDSVAFALASCLGGAPAGFHVQYLSDRHYRFSVANKNVGFHVYKIRRFIGDHFDAYFHLWRNGSADWEREKRLWEIEQERQWTKILSKSSKRVAKTKKKVHFAPESYRSPDNKNLPQKTVSVGQFNIPIDTHVHLQSGSFRFGSVSPGLNKVVSPDLNEDISSSSSESLKSACMHSNKEELPSGKATSMAGSESLPLGLNPNLKQLDFRPVRCARCFELGHQKWACRSRIRCTKCHKLGHIARFCRYRPKPVWVWMPPKFPLTMQHDETPGIILEETIPVIDPRANFHSSSPDANSAFAESSADAEACAHLNAAAMVENAVPKENSTSKFEIIPRRPVLAAIALQFWPWFDNTVRKARLEKMQLEKESTPTPAVVIDQDGIVHGANSATPSNPEQSDFEPDGMRPSLNKGKSPVETIMLPSDLMVSDMQIDEESSGPAQDTAHEAHEEAQLTNNLNKRKGMQLPAPISISDSRTPFIQTAVRRSIRHSAGKEGFRQVSIIKEPSKRTKQWAVEVDEKTGEIKPISVSTLRGWGIDCGVDPMDLTDEAFFQAPTPHKPDDDEDNPLLPDAPSDIRHISSPTFPQ